MNRPIDLGPLARLRRRTWVAAYAFEESRAAHASQGRYLRSAGCCIALFFLTLFKVTN